MGFPNLFGGSKETKEVKSAEAPVQQPKPQSGFSIRPEATPAPSAAQEGTSAQTRASSVFEFGPTVQIGQDYLRGVCIGEDPDAIQACTWSVEPAQGKPRDKHHLYRIEF